MYYMAFLITRKLYSGQLDGLFGRKMLFCFFVEIVLREMIF